MTIRELLAGETGGAFEAMQALRTHLTGEQEFADRVDDLQRPQGYRLVAAIEDDGGASAVAGFRAHAGAVGAPGGPQATPVRA